MIKKALKIITFIIAGLLLLLAILVMLIRVPSVQTKLTQKIAEYLSDELKTTVTVGSVDIEFFSSVILGQLYVEDLHNDTLAYVEELEADIDLFNFFESVLSLDQVRISGGHFELKEYENEDVSNMQFLLDAFSSEDTTASPWSFSLDAVALENCSFIYDNQHVAPNDSGIDFEHLALTGFNLHADEIKFDEDTILLYLQDLKFEDHSGFKLDKLSGRTRISSTEISVKEMNLQTPQTDISSDFFMYTDSYSDYSDFINKVRMLGNFNDSRISSTDIAFFAPDLAELDPQYVVLNGILKGKVSNLKGKDLMLDINGHSYFDGNIELKGLPEIDETFIYLSINDLKTTPQSIELIPVPPFGEHKTIDLPPAMKKLGNIRFQGKFTGFLNDFVAYGKFSTAIGKVSTDISLKGEGENTRYAGAIKTTGFDVGAFFENDSIMGKVSLEVDVNGKGLSREALSAEVDGRIDAIEIYNYTYEKITLKGEIADQQFNGDLLVNDKNLDMDFIGSVNFSGKLPELNFLANINHLNIGKLARSENIDTSAVFSSTLNIDLIGNSIDNLNGKFELYNTIYQDATARHVVDELSLIANTSGLQKSLDLHSNILDAQLVGDYQLEDLAKSYGLFIEKYIPAIVGNKYDTLSVDENFKFNVHLKNTEILSTLFFPTVKIDSGTYINGYYNARGNQLTLEATLSDIEINNMHIYPGYVNFQTEENSLFLNAQIHKIEFGEGLFVDNFTVDSETRTNVSELELSWSNEGKNNEGNINITANYLGLNNLEFLIHDSQIKVSDTIWHIPENSSIRIDSSAIAFNNVLFQSSNEKIALNGKISQNPEDELNVTVDNFDIHTFNLIIPEKTLKLNGRISGNASLKDPYHKLIFSSNIDFKEFKLNNNVMGDGTLKTNWLNEMEVLHVDGNLIRGPIPTIQFRGNYYPKKDDENLNLTLELQNTYLQLFQPYVDGILSDLKGYASGKIKITGSTNEPKLKGKLQLQKASFTVDYLKTSYSLSDNIIIEEDWIGFDNITIFDAKRGKAVATGTVFHDNFSDFSMDIYIQADKFHCLNTTEKDNELYYGQAYVSGDIDISGHTDNLTIEANVTTERSYPQPRSEYTVFNIPLNNPDEASENGFVRFINTKDTLRKTLKLPEADLTGIEMKFNLTVTPDAEVKLIFDEKVGDILKAKGHGNIELEINTKGDFSIFGDYIIDRGDYLFTLQNVINKRFTLQPGGSISWNGDPYSGTIDISAVYRLRARLSDILITTDSTSDYTKRIPVELVLNMENTVLSPDITFDIRLPTADENTKSLLHNVLYVGTNETNENLMNKQAFSLLILNRFTPPDQGLSGSGFGAANSSELLSNQLSNWLSQISDKYDIGFAYRPGDELTTDQVELALSTQLFNDRIVVDANAEYGGNQAVNQSSQTTNTLVGDVTVEYKIREDGRFRVKAFNKSNNNNFLKNNNPYTQGVGIFYKIEFQSLWDIFKKKGRRSKDDDMEEEEEPENNDEDTMDDEETDAVN